MPARSHGRRSTLTAKPACRAVGSKVNAPLYLSTSDGRTTSVGVLLTRRFLRPVCCQDLPRALLPPVLRDGNLLNLWRRQEGALGRH